mgnify:CR=1 FL=1
MTVEYVAIVLASLALFGVVAIVLYLVIDYRASRDAGEIMERARQTLEPYTPKFPRRKDR